MELTAIDPDLKTAFIAMAAAREGTGFQVVAGGIGERVFHFNGTGKFERATPLPRIGGSFSRGFTGDVALLERLRGAPGDRIVHFELDVLRSIGDTGGRAVIRISLPWITMTQDDRPGLTPFFPAWPSFGIDRDGGIAWSPGDRFVIHRLDQHDREVWTVRGEFSGPDITAEDMAAERARATAPDVPEQLTPEQLDTMTSRTSKFLPAISGILVSRKSEVLVTGALSPARDSVSCYRLTSAGTLVGQFRIPRRTRPLLYAGDSMLVHRPTPGEPWEVVWLHLKAAAR
jgi:hypothetical protein